MKKQLFPDDLGSAGMSRSGSFIAKAAADVLINNATSRPNGYDVDASLLANYISESDADNVRIVLAKNDDGSPTIVVYCMKGGEARYHNEPGVGDSVLEHVFPLDINTPI